MDTGNFGGDRDEEDPQGTVVHRISRLRRKAASVLGLVKIKNGGGPRTEVELRTASVETSWRCVVYRYAARRIVVGDNACRWDAKVRWPLAAENWMT